MTATTTSRQRRGAETTTRPVVVIPGHTNAAGSTTTLRRRFAELGFSDVHALAAVGHADIPHLADQLARRVEGVCALTGADEVHLVGQGIGGIVVRYYVGVLGGDRRVHSAVTVGTPHAGTATASLELGPAAAQLRPGSAVMERLESSVRPSRVHWLNYFCEHDLLVNPAASGVLRHPLVNATNFLVTEHGHLSLALPSEVARSIVAQLGAADGLPHQGSPLAALPGAIVRLTPQPVEVSPAVARSRAMHPSNQPPRRSKLHEVPLRARSAR